MTNTVKRQGSPATVKNIRSTDRHYPGADVNTERLVNKLRHRGITDPRAAVRRPSSALIDDACSSSPQSAAPKAFDNNYSPYSNVNAEAAEQTARRQAEARLRAESERLRQNGGVPAVRQGAGRTVSSRQSAVTSPDVRRVRSAPGSGRPASTVPAARPKPARERGQLAESGPREVAIKRVPFPKFAFVLIFVFVVLFFMVQSFVKNYEYRQEIAELQGEVEVLSERTAQLRAQLEERIDLDEVKDRAEGIGMIKNGQADEKYIDLSGGDIIENFGRGDEDLGTFTTMLSAIRKRISGILGSDE